MKDDKIYHHLAVFHKEFGDVINLMLDRVKTENMPKSVVLYEHPIRIKNGFLSLGLNRDNGDFYLHGKNCDGEYVHIML